VSCDLLPNTGLGAHVGLLLILAMACMIAGTTVLLLARRARGGRSVLVFLLLLGTVTTVSTFGLTTPAQAAPGCSSSPSTSSGSSTGSNTGSTSAPSSGSPTESTSAPAASASVHRVTFTQTSAVAGLAPGVAPANISGRLVNDSVESARITAVGVEIASVSTRSNASAGTCGVSDYQVLAATMPVGRTLGPGASTAFAGASIGFNNKQDTNQDACKGATIHLRYTANPS
jgi:hypothetical protein